MHPNPAFRGTARDTNIAFAREQGFGMLVVDTDAGSLLSHIPFLISDDGTLAEFHLVRSNPIARALTTPLQAKIAVQGPHGYISPDWYGIDDQVPTWNYVAVHLTGDITLRPQDTLLNLLGRQSAQQEALLTPKTPWTTSKMTPEVLDKMMRQIVPCAMAITKIDGTWKLGQNKDDTVRKDAADHLDANGLGLEPRLLAALMKGV